MLEELFAKFEGAYAPRTIANYRSDFANFTKWCEAQGIDPLEASPSELARFIDDMMSRWGSSTIKHHVAAINTVYRLSDRVPIGDSPEVLLALKRFQRKKGNWQKQASPLTREILIKLLAICDDGVRGLRDRVLLRLGYESLARRAELCSFRFDDLYQRPDGPAAINLRFAKNDQFGDGRLIPISEELHADIRAWAEMTGGTGFILRRVNHCGDIGRELKPTGVNQALKELQRRAGLDMDKPLSGHSFRVGGALDLLEKGVSLEKIMLRGGWRSETNIMRYLRAWQLGR